MTLLQVESNIKSHLVAIIVVLALVFGAVWGVDSLIARHDGATSARYETLLANQTAQTVALQKQLTIDEAQWSVIQAQLLAANAQLVKTIQQRDASTKQQQTIDASLDTSTAAQRLAQQVRANPGEVNVGAGDTVVLDLPVTRSVVSSLDLLPTVQSDLADTRTQLANETTIANNALSDVAAEKAVVVSQAKQLVDQTNACVAQVKTLRAHQRKNLIKAFFAGVVTGIIGGHAAGI
jgi:hypothetical protein